MPELVYLKRATVKGAPLEVKAEMNWDKWNIRKAGPDHWDAFAPEWDDEKGMCFKTFPDALRYVLEYAVPKPFLIRKLPLLKSAPWTIISPRRLQMIGCLGYTYGDGQWAYPFKSQRVAMIALENALRRETK